MPVFNLNTTSGANATADNSLYIVGNNSQVTNTGIAFDFGAFSNSALVVQGLVASATGIGVNNSDGAVVNRLTIAASGTVVADGDAIYWASGGVIINDGSIQSFTDDGINILEGSTIVINNGLLSAEDNGIVASGSGNRITNTGTIVAADRGVFFDTGNSDLNNSGSIFGLVAGIDSSFVGSGETRITNTGLISGGVNGQALRGGDGVEIVRNSGTMDGDIDLAGGADLYRGIGGFVAGTVDGGAGNDTLIGGNDTDIFDGGSEADQIRGRGGDDDLSGGSGNDTIDGGGGNDIIAGDDGEDRLFGRDGNDELTGGLGNDRLSGGDGNDELTGGSGADRQTGGAGADTFIYTAAAQSPAAGGFDVITDFTTGEDQIDLSGIVGPDLTFIGTGAFSGTQGEVRYVANAKGNASVFADVDGDGIADLRIFLVNVQSLEQGDFVL